MRKVLVGIDVEVNDWVVVDSGGISGVISNSETYSVGPGISEIDVGQSPIPGVTIGTDGSSA